MKIVIPCLPIVVQSGFLESRFVFQRTYYEPTAPYTWRPLYDVRKKRMRSGGIAEMVCPRRHLFQLNIAIFAGYEPSAEGVVGHSITCPYCQFVIRAPWRLDCWHDH